MALSSNAPLAKFSKKRLAELAALGRKPWSTFTPTPREKQTKAKRPRQTGPDAATVQIVVDRDGGCVVCGGALHGQRGLDWSVHHRKRRSQGLDNSPANLMATCGHGTAGCHGKIHASVQWARDNGWLLRGRQDPVLEPVQHFLNGLVWLLADGGWSSRRPEVAP